MLYYRKGGASVAVETAIKSGGVKGQELCWSSFLTDHLQSLQVPDLNPFAVQLNDLITAEF